MSTLSARALSVFIAVTAVATAVLPLQRTFAQTDDALPRRAGIPTMIPTLLLPPVPSVAPGYRAPQAAPSGAHIIGVTAQPFVGISLQDAIAMTLVKNPNLAVSTSNVRVARYNVVAARGAYDVALHLQPSSNFSVNPPQNFIDAGPGEVGKYGSGGAAIYTSAPGNVVQHQSTFQYGLSGETENGTSYQAGIQQSRTYNNTTFDAFNPYYLATLNLSVTQPLLKNAGTNAGKRQLRLALINADTGVAQTLVEASNAISQVDDAYWSLVAAWRNVAIREEALREAIAQQQSNVRLAARGAAAPIDAVQSQTQVANFQDDVFMALQNVSQLQNELKTLISTDAADPIWNANLVPSTSVQQLPAASDLSTVTAQAQQNRPEVRQAEERRLAADIDRAFAANQSLPQADVALQYESNGFAGIPAPVPVFLTELLQLRQSHRVPDSAAEHARHDGVGLSQYVGRLFPYVQRRLGRQLSDPRPPRARPARPCE